jgi:hypothetical protein
LINEDVTSEKSTYVEALMQHYGWRSRFIDLSDNPLVSLFFAGYAFSMKKVNHMTEDCFEEFLIEVKNEAYYSISSETQGYLYVIDRERVESIAPNTLVDLKEGLTDKNLRPIRQSGYLLENADGSLNRVVNNSIVEVLKIDTSIITELCEAENVTSDNLFPNNDEDIIYNVLLSLPRKEIVLENGENSNFFIKLFNLPEYNINYAKFQLPHIAYYSSFWIKDIIQESLSGNQESKSRYLDALDIRCRDDISFHFSTQFDDKLECRNLLEVLRKISTLIIEYDNLFKYHVENVTEYQKGIILEIVDNMVKVEEIGVDYVGKSLQGVIGFKPRYYSIIGDEFVEPIRIVGDCPCNDDRRHDHLIFVAKKLIDGIVSGGLKASRESDRTIYC